jgi:hypothetical protein
MRCSREIRDLAGSPIRERSRRCALPIETGQYKIEPPRQWCHLVNAGTAASSRMRGDKQRQHPPGILGSAWKQDCHGPSVPVPSVVPGAQNHRLRINVLTNRDGRYVRPSRWVRHSTPTGVRRQRTHKPKNRNYEEHETSHDPIIVDDALHGGGDEAVSIP